MTRERIEDIREIVLPFVRQRLIEINYENLGKADAKEFENDFNEILNLAIKTLEQPTVAENAIAQQLGNSEELGTTKKNLVVEAQEPCEDMEKKIEKEYLFESLCEDLKKLQAENEQLSSGLEKNSKKLEKDFGELDCVSRQAVLDQAKDYGSGTFLIPVNAVKELPPVNPQEPRKGHWIMLPIMTHECSNCGIRKDYELEWNYCPNCGCRMSEVNK